MAGNISPRVFVVYMTGMTLGPQKGVPENVSFEQTKK
jgi:hypothetical protein